MGRNVKCQDTGEIVDSKLAYKAENKKYYSCKEAYDKLLINKEYKDKCLNLLTEYLGYKEGMKFPTITYKKINEFEPYGFNTLFNTIKSQKNAIEWALNNKQFNGETAKIMYIMAIIQNNIMDEYKKGVAESKRVKPVIDNTDLLFGVEAIPVRKTQNSNNISKWLEEEDE